MTAVASGRSLLPDRAVGGAPDQDRDRSRGRVQALRIGLVSLDTAGATARFDYVRTYAS
ncbi:hypothetical protein ACFFS2_09240 [Streptomyces aurantiacus]|uniref:hypothetical protein n=1 Tax=Streptomyces aurantiacus TaxID=47760 RepID=UPI000A4876FF|nr:hypothetical protein [Streptomyces aurantiacus]